MSVAVTPPPSRPDRPLIGVHVAAKDPLRCAVEEGAEVIQLHLANPQAWRPPRTRPDAAALRASPLPLFVHAPYLINLAAANPTTWERSVVLLGQVLTVAAEVGAEGVVVHGGSTVGDPPEDGCRRWRTAVRRLRGEAPPVPLLVENTAGRTTFTRTVEGFDRLWEAAGGLGLGTVFDTCHAHAGDGPALLAFVEALERVTGPIDLVHGNDSRAEAGSGRDRHAHVGRGTIDPEVMLTAMLAARAPIVLETPPEDRLADLGWLRGRLGLGPVPLPSEVGQPG